MEWFADVLLKSPQGWKMSGYDLDSWVEGVEPMSHGIVMLPDFDGQESPQYDMSQSGVFWGLRLGHRPEHLVRALMEGVAFGLKAIYEAFPVPTHTKAGTLTVTGGGAYSATWMKVLASVFDRPLLRSRTEVSALGAAVLAATGVGAYRSVTQAVQAMAEPGAPVDPVDDWVSVYAAGYRQFTALRTRA